MHATIFLVLIREQIYFQNIFCNSHRKSGYFHVSIFWPIKLTHLIFVVPVHSCKKKFIVFYCF